MDEAKQRVIDSLKLYHDTSFTPGVYEHSIFGRAALLLEVDAVPVTQHIELREQYDRVFTAFHELRDDFISYVCSGVPNPSPFCKNRCANCVDAVEVVRCRDCRFCKKHPTSDKTKICTNERWNTEYHPFAHDEGFCSYGERNNDNEKS